MSNVKRGYIFPRISKFDAIVRWEEIADKEIDELTSLVSLECEKVVFNATGNRVPKELLEELRGKVLDVARESGFSAKNSKKEMRVFDIKCARFLYDHMQIIPGEAARDEVWNHLTLFVLPDIARWRFPGAGKERFVGGRSQRNTFQRLWWRSHTLREVEGEPDRHLELPEDALVQIMERPGISSSSSLAKAVATVVLDASDLLSTGEQTGDLTAEELIRRMCKVVRQRNVFVELCSVTRELCEEQLRKMMRSLVAYHASGSDGKDG